LTIVDVLSTKVALLTPLTSRSWWIVYRNG